MRIDILTQDSRWESIPLKEPCRKALILSLAFTKENLGKYGISVLACDDSEIANLNLKFRGVNKSTNILAWPEYDLKNDRPGSLPKGLNTIVNKCSSEISLGNLALSFDRCFSEAQQSSLNFRDYITHLCLHGCLHLLGFDHVDEKDATLMEEIEVNLLYSVGIKNPYEFDKYR